MTTIDYQAFKRRRRRWPLVAAVVANSPHSGDTNLDGSVGFVDLVNEGQTQGDPPPLHWYDGMRMAMGTWILMRVGAGGDWGSAYSLGGGVCGDWGSLSLALEFLRRGTA